MGIRRLLNNNNKTTTKDCSPNRSCFFAQLLTCSPASSNSVLTPSPFLAESAGRTKPASKNCSVFFVRTLELEWGRKVLETWEFELMWRVGLFFSVQSLSLNTVEKMQAEVEPSKKWTDWEIVLPRWKTINFSSLQKTWLLTFFPHTVVGHPNSFCIFVVLWIVCIEQQGGKGSTSCSSLTAVSVFGQQTTKQSPPFIVRLTHLQLETKSL